jgi:hypothetical protein
VVYARRGRASAVESGAEENLTKVIGESGEIRMMKTSERRGSEKRPLVAVMSLRLVMTISNVLYQFHVYSLEEVRATSPNKSYHLLFVASFLALVVTTELPSILRELPLIQAQIECWSVYFFLRGLLLVPRILAFELPASFVLAAMCVLAIYSLLAIYRPIEFGKRDDVSSDPGQTPGSGVDETE